MGGIWMNKKNVVILPQVKQTYDKMLHQAMKFMHAAKYEEAIVLFEKLQQFPIQSSDVHFNSLICYMKLNRLNEAEMYCEELLTNEDEPLYYEYVSYYLLILFEQKKYRTVIVEVSRMRKKEVPNTYEKKYLQLNHVAEQMINEEAHQVQMELKRAFQTTDYERQFQLLKRWQDLTIEPNEFIVSLLIKRDVHPTLKTIILETMKQLEIVEPVSLEKFGIVQTIHIQKIPFAFETPFYLDVKRNIHEEEQENPTLLHMMEQLLSQCVVVRYPFYFASNEIPFFVDALKVVANNLLGIKTQQMKDGERKQFFIETIRLCHELTLLEG